MPGITSDRRCHAERGRLIGGGPIVRYRNGRLRHLLVDTEACRLHQPLPGNRAQSGRIGSHVRSRHRRSGYRYPLFRQAAAMEECNQAPTGACFPCRQPEISGPYKLGWSGRPSQRKPDSPLGDIPPRSQVVKLVPVEQSLAATGIRTARGSLVSRLPSLPQLGTQAKSDG